jgi:hypothetical protein
MQRRFYTSTSEPETPLNTTLEDSIHMPQKRNRRAATSGTYPPQNTPQPQFPPSTRHSPQTILQNTPYGSISILPSGPRRHPLPQRPLRDPEPLWGNAYNALRQPTNVSHPPRGMINSPRSSIDLPYPQHVNDRSGYNPHPGRAGAPRRPSALTREEQDVLDWTGMHALRPSSPVTSPRPVLARKDANTPLTGSLFKIPYSKIHEAANFGVPHPGGYVARDRAMSEVVEEPSPLTVFSRKGEGKATDGGRGGGGTMDRVKQLRAANQERKIEELARELARPAKAVLVSERKGKEKVTKEAQTVAQQVQGTEANAHLQIPPPVEHSAQTPLSRLQRSNGLAVTDEIDTLASTLVSPSLYQSLSASPPRAFKHPGAVPAPVDLAGINAAQEAGTESKSSQESVSSSEYEKIGKPGSGEVGDNGLVERKWYKGFRR